MQSLNPPPSNVGYAVLLVVGNTYSPGCEAMIFPLPLPAQSALPESCPRPAAGSQVSEPVDLRSTNGVLRVQLSYRSSVDAAGRARYCYVSKDGSEAPNLRVKPGDLLILKLRNEISDDSHFQPAQAPIPGHSMAMNSPGASIRSACASAVMSALSTNLHFHGLTVPPRLPSGRRLENDDPARRSAVRI